MIKLRGWKGPLDHLNYKILTLIKNKEAEYPRKIYNELRVKEKVSHSTVDYRLNFLDKARYISKGDKDFVITPDGEVALKSWDVVSGTTVWIRMIEGTREKPMNAYLTVLCEKDIVTHISFSDSQHQDFVGSEHFAFNNVTEPISIEIQSREAYVKLEQREEKRFNF